MTPLTLNPSRRMRALIVAVAVAALTAGGYGLSRLAPEVGQGARPIVFATVGKTTVSLAADQADPVSGTVNVTLTADPSPTHAEFFLDGVLAYTDTVTPWAWAWDTTTVADGNHTVRGEAVYARKRARASLTLTVQNPPPTTTGTTATTATTTVPTTTTATTVPPPPPGTANAWVDTTGGTCQRTTAPATYSDPAACPSLNAAYQAAQPGDLILVKAGGYPTQTIANRASLPVGSTQIVVQPAPGETVTLYDLTVFTHDIAVEGGDVLGADEPNRLTATYGVDMQMAAAGDGDRHILVEDVHAESTFINAWATTLRFSEIGPLNVCAGRSDDLVKGWWFNTPSGEQGIQRLRLEYNLIHDAHDEGCAASSPHDDAIHVEADNSLIRGNRIWWCGTQCIFQGYNGQGNVVEDNTVEESSGCARCGDSSEVGFAGTTTLQNNTILGTVTFSGGPIPAAATVRDNVFLSGVSCDPAGTYSYNVYPASGGSACGTHAVRGTPSLTADWHLAPGDVVATGAADPAAFSPVDIDGQARPQGAAADAGADEH